jgi:hypothetical protein
VRSTCQGIFPQSRDGARCSLKNGARHVNHASPLPTAPPHAHQLATGPSPSPPTSFGVVPPSCTCPPTADRPSLPCHRTHRSVKAFRHNGPALTARSPSHRTALASHGVHHLLCVRTPLALATASTVRLCTQRPSRPAASSPGCIPT